MTGGTRFTIDDTVALAAFIAPRRPEVEIAPEPDAVPVEHPLVMQPIFEVCDREGLPLFLETETTANVAYYGHHGFRVRSEWDMPLDGPHMWGMLREPSG